MIHIDGLRFQYSASGFCLRIPRLRIADGECVAIVGPSGVGKTTLIYLLSGILSPQAGTLHLAGVDLAGKSDSARRAFRIARIGFVFQEFELVDYLPVRHNILLPYYLNNALPLTPDVRRHADALAESVGIGDKLKRCPNSLSQGEKQRVAICRALVTSPELVIADEPTGNLDPTMARAILDLLLGEVRQRSATLLMVTHNLALLDAFDRVVDLQQYLCEAAS